MIGHPKVEGTRVPEYVYRALYSGAHPKETGTTPQASGAPRAQLAVILNDQTGLVG